MDQNLPSTIGAFVVAAGVLLVLMDLALNFCLSINADASNSFGAGTLEWLPQDSYPTRSIPLVTYREPLWANPELPRQVEAGQHLPPGTTTGLRETLVTSPIDATPQQIAIVPGPGWAHVVAAIGTTGFFLALTVQAYALFRGFGLLGVAAMLHWMWNGKALGPISPSVYISGGYKAAGLCLRL